MKPNPPAQGLYSPEFEHDACGVGFVCHLKGKPSHQVVLDGLTVLENMEHRGATGADPNSGDGAGILVRMPDKFLRRKCAEMNIELPAPGQYAVAMCFLPRHPAHRHECEQALVEVARENNLEVLGWRTVPTNPQGLGAAPLSAEPIIRQCFLKPDQSFYNKADFDRRLYLVRQHAENLVEFGPFYSKSSQEMFYICMLSANRLVYKGMLTAPQLRTYFPDLSEPDFESSLALVHSRFSTNTWPAWRLAHPYRYLAHNGEINTLYGNRNWMRARYKSLRSEIFGDELEKMYPILTESGSDSATLDNALQFLCVNGRSLPHAVMMLIPEAWQNNDLLDDELKAFYEYHACMMEPWDGPAAVLFTNGYLIGGVLDRNGLRPARYYVTKDDLVVMASEAGVLPVAPERISRKGRLQPGKIFLIDIQQGRIIEDQEVKAELVDKRPWLKWIREHLVKLDDLPAPFQEPAGYSIKKAPLIQRQRLFGYTLEDLNLILEPMAQNGQEPISSMGADTPLACLSDKPQLLYNYFKQLFAQVTNPPLDANFEALVTSLNTYIGRSSNLLSENPGNCRMVKLKTPILSNLELEKIKALDEPGLRSTTLPMLFDSRRAGALELAVEELCRAAAIAVRDGFSILVLSDRDAGRESAPIPALLATSAVNHHLIKEGVRTQVSLLIETGEAREIHHFCLLVGYGASAVNPYLALETIRDQAEKGRLGSTLTPEKAQANYIKAASKGLIKVASKMGISTIQSYRGAQIFEALGISKTVIEKYFSGTVSRIDGVNLEVLAREALERHRKALAAAQQPGDSLPVGGFYKWRKGEEFHMWNPETVAKLRHAAETGDYNDYKEYSRSAGNESQSRCTLRGMLDFKSPGPGIPLDEVEPVAEIVRRFATGAMSFGSISKEAHENIALAMNRIGGKSNTGEGGEDPRRFKADTQGLRRSAIKQVASGRFGVTSEYLVNADELQIKMAQGAKPGEGGQLPGHKVDEFIGQVRHTTPGVGLISPPPHHDIYSIEDLAQLIHDLKNVNPQARISVKLVSEVGVGTIAAGVAKAKADHILVSGDSGGTGASPLTSIKYAGLPWELGLAETQQTLLLHKLRGRVTLQTDGQIKTGRDVAIAFLLGAEEVGVSTAPLIASGCVMMRACHLNTCPAGIATQDPELRRNFKGKPEHIVNFMFFVAEELREIMAQLGFRSVDEMIGRVDCLTIADVSDHPKARYLDLKSLLYVPASEGVPRRCTEKQNHALSGVMDNRLIELAAPALEKGEQVFAELPIENTNRTVGGMLSGAVARKYGFKGLPDETIHFKFTGSAGQSFGAFLAHGVRLSLEGEANDYVGKGLSGGQIVIRPPQESAIKAEENIIAGNVVCYGATAGEVFIRGVVGERFCVRNSGANAVVEGTGDHGCEYMTGGRVVVIGKTGRNFAAGMSGGIAYVYDPQKNFRRCCNQDLVELEELVEAPDLACVKDLLQRHAEMTGSEAAARILAEWDKARARFVKVIPTEYRRALENQAVMAAKAKELSQSQISV